VISKILSQAGENRPYENKGKQEKKFDAAFRVMHLELVGVFIKQTETLYFFSL
jgi:hypothetical protein